MRSSAAELVGRGGFEEGAPPRGVRGDLAAVALEAAQRGAVRPIDLVAGLDARALRRARRFAIPAEIRLDVGDSDHLLGIGLRAAQFTPAGRAFFAARLHLRARRFDSR